MHPRITSRLPNSKSSPDGVLLFRKHPPCVSKRWIARLTSILGLIVVLASCARDPQREKQKYLNSGIAYLNKGKYQEAILQFQNSLKLDPRYTDAYARLGQAYLADRNYGDAYTAFQQVIHLDASRLDARVSLGQLYVSARQFAKAEDQASLVLKRDPNNAAAYLVLGVSLLMQQQNERALQAYSKLVELKPKDPANYVNVGVIESRLGRNQTAEHNFQKAIQTGPHFPQAYTNLASFYELNKQFARAEEVLQRGVEKNRDTPSLYMSWAELLYAEQKKESAETVLRQLADRQSKSAGVALMIGNFYLTHVGTDKALAEYRRGLAIDSHNTEIEDQIVQCYLATGHIKEATVLNSEVLKQSPKDVSGGISRARILLANGRTQDAILVLRNLLKRSPDLTGAHYLVGLAYWQNQDFGQAKNEFQETLRQAPGLLAAEHSLAELDMVLGQPEPAFELAQAIVNKYPNQPAERILLGTAYLRLGQPAKGEEQFLVARQLAPTDPSVAFDLAVAYRANRKFEEAEREFEAALKLNPQFVQAIDGLASLWVDRNQRPKAVARAEQYVAAYPDDPIGHLILGSLRSDDKQYENAKSEFQKAAQLKPTLVMAQTRLGDTFRALGNMPEAIRAYERAVTLQPASASLQTILGDLYSKQNDQDLAEKHYQAALTADPNDGIAANNLAWMYLKNGGNLDVALGLAQRAKQSAPDVVNLTDTLAWIQYKKGLYAGAVPLLEDCVAKAPQSPVYRYHLGMALLATGDAQTAKTQLETALRLNLTGEDADQARKTVNHLN